MDRVKENVNRETSKNVPEITNSGSIKSLTAFIATLFESFANFAEKLDKVSLSTKVILLIILLSFIVPISIGIMIYLIFAGLSIIFRG